MRKHKCSCGCDLWWVDVGFINDKTYPTAYIACSGCGKVSKLEAELTFKRTDTLDICMNPRYYNKKGELI